MSASHDQLPAFPAFPAFPAVASGEAQLKLALQAYKLRDLAAAGSGIREHKTTGSNSCGATCCSNDCYTRHGYTCTGGCKSNSMLPEARPKQADVPLAALLARGVRPAAMAAA